MNARRQRRRSAFTSSLHYQPRADRLCQTRQGTRLAGVTQQRGRCARAGRKRGRDDAPPRIDSHRHFSAQSTLCWSEAVGWARQKCRSGVTRSDTLCRPDRGPELVKRPFRPVHNSPKRCLSPGRSAFSYYTRRDFPSTEKIPLSFSEMSWGVETRQNGKLSGSL